MENQQNQEALDETVTRLVSRVKKNNETYAAYGCQLIFSGEARWDGIDLIEMRDRRMDINVNQGFYKARIQHTTPFEMFGDFDLACDDHLTHLLKNLQQLVTDENCEMLDLFEERSSRTPILTKRMVRRTIAMLTISMASIGSGMQKTSIGHITAMAMRLKHARSLRAHSRVRSSTTRRMSGKSYTKSMTRLKIHRLRSGDFYDGINLFEGSGIVFYPAEDEEGPEIHFSLNEADAALHFLLTGERPASAEVMPSA